MAFIMKDEVFAEMKDVCRAMHREGKKLKVEEALMNLMNMEGMPMHCPYHHFMMPGALLTLAAVDEGKSEEELNQWLDLAEERAKNVLPGFCGLYGACGAAVGAGIFVSIYTGGTPMSGENWKWANEATGKSLLRIAQYPGPRCCKRTSFLAALEAVPYINEKCGLHFEITEDITCRYHQKNAECLESKCPFYKDGKEA